MRNDDFVIRPTTESDWMSVRALRLEMLRDTPEAFGETVQTAQGLDEDAWRMRAARGTSDTGIYLAAIAGSSWVGIMGGYLGDVLSGPMLVGVYVTPGYRGAARGVADALLAGIEDWARGHGPTLTLHVHEDNPRARAFYERRGFVPTGRTFPYVLDRTERELELRKTL
jgi:GNAT superfamily N-acetyltransferase